MSRSMNMARKGVWHSIVGVAASCGVTGTLEAQSSPSNFTSAVRYDPGGQVTGTIAPNAMGSMGSSLPYQAVRNTYDAAGLLIRVEKGYLATWPGDAAPASWSGFTILTIVDTTYDAMSRKTSDAVSGVASNVPTIRQFTQYSYDGAGRLECTAVRMNPASFGSLATGACSLTAASTTYGDDRITRNVYDADGQVLKVQKAYGTSLQQDYATYEYTANGKPKAMIDANGNRAEMTYDGLDRQTEWRFPDKASVGSASASDYEAYGYDANGNRTSLRKRDNRTISYAYDALNRLIAKTYPNGGARSVYYSYDLRGLQTAARFDSASGGDAVTSTWDGFGRQSSSTTAMGGTSRTLGYAYNANGARSRITWPDGHYSNTIRYDSDQVYYADIDGAVALFHTPLEPTGRIAALYRWISAGSTWGGATFYGYDDLSRVTSTNQQFTGGTGNVVTGFDYNPASQRVSKSRDNDAYAFNAYVNVSRSYARNGLNQYTSAGPATFNYDANGNLASDGTTSYGYDIENRLTSASSGATLVYDTLGRLYETSVSGGNIMRLLYDGDALVGEYDAGGNMLKRYVHSDGEDDPLVEYSGSAVSSPAYLIADHQGSIVARADQNDSLLQINRYDEYGIPGTGNTGRFQYTGQAWLPELGMYYYKARIYSPTLGRFLQTDPIGYADQNNLYAYVANDPLNRTDPTGNYQRGEGFTDDQWKKFDKAQQGAAKDMNSRAGKLEERAAKRDADGKPGGDRMRTQASNLRAGAAAASATGSNAPKANLLSAAAYAAAGRADGSQAFTTRDGGTTNFNASGIFGETISGPKWIIGHDAMHTKGLGPGLGDERGPNGQRAYRYGPEPNVDAYNSMRNTDQGARNPDNLMGEVYP